MTKIKQYHKQIKETAKPKDINTQIKVVESNSNVKLERRQTSINIIKNLSWGCERRQRPVESQTRIRAII